jgi:hypothetical protein
MKRLLISLSLLASGCAAVAHAQVPVQGSTVTATVSLGAPVVATNFSQVNGQPGAYAGNLGFTSYGKNGTGDMDFVAANGGASPSFYWWYLLGSTPTIEMFLDVNGNLRVPNGGLIAGTRVQAAQLAATVFTVATLPSASGAGAGTQVVVSDCTTVTVGPLCTGGGTNYMLALSNGTNWTVH